ncbi:MAG TPA: carbamoyl-phosphate synthase domain-containing protein, partial [Candidatus Omnitrophota bacterium]|nr:carbamoyl-phosphate synthase domain-containing protein [Candidatus Omnitrophota bacterium]
MHEQRTAMEPNFDIPRPPGATGALVLADGTVLWGKGVGAAGMSVGEVVFNTSMTGYQETLTDPSYAGQIITFTFPHIGNVGTNGEDIETVTPAARGCILRADITDPANWRANRHLDEWMKSFGMVGLSGVDTRALTRRIRDAGAPNGTVVHAPDGDFDLRGAWKMAAEWPGLEGMDLAKDVTCRQQYSWDEGEWVLGQGYVTQTAPKHHVVAIDFGAKRNILRCL